VTKEQIIENTGFELLFADNVTTTPEPTGRELQILRQQVDPQGRVIAKVLNGQRA
jgi:hypothetical protein